MREWIVETEVAGNDHNEKSQIHENIILGNYWMQKNIVRLNYFLFSMHQNIGYVFLYSHPEIPQCLNIPRSAANVAVCMWSITYTFVICLTSSRCVRDRRKQLFDDAFVCTVTCAYLMRLFHEQQFIKKTMLFLVLAGFSSTLTKTLTLYSASKSLVALQT